MRERDVMERERVWGWLEKMIELCPGQRQMFTGRFYEVSAKFPHYNFSKIQMTFCGFGAGFIPEGLWMLPQVGWWWVQILFLSLEWNQPHMIQPHITPHSLHSSCLVSWKFFWHLLLFHLMLFSPRAMRLTSSPPLVSPKCPLPSEDWLSPCWNYILTP